ncbi:hypothetical protein J1605_013382 [Eschrichtius robustus]|uniref:Uncharacterized protein n=1 Tax=Eschrichtius robustus TaxID=9764 RepID=A0AB34GJ12_ESCRO|nr:hypothetical protein J1605_013382 [Eschrichtius robustus]
MEAGEEDEEPARKEVTTGPLVALGDPWGLVRVPVSREDEPRAYPGLGSSSGCGGGGRCSHVWAHGRPLRQLIGIRKLSHLKALTRQARPTPKLRFLIPVELTPPTVGRGCAFSCFLIPSRRNVLGALALGVMPIWGQPTFALGEDLRKHQVHMA